MNIPKCDIKAHFGRTALTLENPELRRSVTFAYADYPKIFGHPRFLVADFVEGVALIKGGMKQLAKRWALLPPRVLISVERSMPGGFTSIDSKLLAEIFTSAGARGVLLKKPRETTSHLAQHVRPVRRSGW